MRYSRRFARLLLTDGDKRKRSYWVDLIDQMRPQDFKKTRFDCFSLGGGHTGFAETENVTYFGNRLPHRVQFDNLFALIRRQYSEDASTPLQALACTKHVFPIHNSAGTITFAYLYGQSMRPVPKRIDLLRR